MDTKRYLFTLVIFLSLSSYALGMEQTKEFDGFIFKLTFDKTPPKALDGVLITLSAYNITTGQFVQPTFVSLKVSKIGTLLFPPALLETKKDNTGSFSYTFPEGGNYRLDFSMENQAKIQNVTFNISVAYIDSEKTARPISIVFVAVIVTALIALILARFMNTI